MKRFFLAAIILVLIFVSIPLPSSALPEGPVITAQSALLIDAERGQILCQLNPDERMNVPSANKIMATIIAIEKADLSSTVTISKEAINTDVPVLSLNAGERIKLSDLLYATLMTSSNDAVNAVAEHVGGSIENFVKLMNETAAKLGMSDTHFVNATGLYNEQQYTTASDIAKLIKYAIANKQFSSIFSAKGRPWSSENGPAVLINHNNMFYRYGDVDGGQLTYDINETVNAITSATKNDMKLISIVLHSTEENVYDDTRSLLDFGFNNYMRGLLVAKNTVLKTVTYNSKEYKLMPIEDQYYIYPIGEDFVSNVTVEVDNNLKPPITKTQIVGTAKYELYDGTVINVYLYPDRDIISAVNFISYIKYKLTNNKEIASLLIILVLAELVMAIGKLTGFIKASRARKRNKRTQNSI